MTQLFFRTAMFFLGLWLTYYFGTDTLKPIVYRMSGECVTGRIEGFLAGKYNPSVQPESTGIRNGNNKARRPVFRYPIAPKATDSLSGRQGSGILFPLLQYNLHEKVTVVFPKNNPKDAYIFNFMTILVSFLLTLFSLYMVKMGLMGSD
jgi:hypothetical protein